MKGNTCTSIPLTGWTCCPTTISRTGACGRRLMGSGCAWGLSCKRPLTVWRDGFEVAMTANVQTSPCVCQVTWFIVPYGSSKGARPRCFTYPSARARRVETSCLQAGAAPHIFVSLIHLPDESRYFQTKATDAHIFQQTLIH